MPNLTLLDIAKLNGNDKVIGLIEENLSAAPELEIFPIRQVKGTSFTTLKRTAYPTTGFRAANAGFTASKSAFTKQLTPLHIFGGMINVDAAVAKAHEDGPGVVEMYEASGIVRSAFITLGKQIWYGTANDATGFPGLKTFTPFGGTMTVNATGTTANTASSVYAVKFGPQDAQIVLNEGARFELSTFKDQQVPDPNDATKVLKARVADLTTWVGFSVLNTNCCARICNLTADSGKGLTDALLSMLFETFPVGFTPDAIFATKRSRGQLQRSRPASIYSQAGVAPGKGGGNATISATPTEFEGVPIIATDCILNTDAIET